MYSKRTSRIFFFLLAIFFLITAPVVIFYSLGYRYSFDKGVFVYGGSITIKSNPQSVNILVDSKPVSQRKINFINNSYHIDGIRPGTHTVEVTADGYNSWLKTVEVHSGISTEFWNVVLTRKEYSLNNFSAATGRFFPSPKNDYLALTHWIDRNLSVSLLKINGGTDEEYFSSHEYAFTSNNNLNIEWSPQEQKILIPVEKDGEKNYFIVTLGDKSAAKVSDLAKMENIDDARWDNSRKNYLYFVSQNNLYQLNSDKPEEISLAANNISAYDLSGSWVYYLDGASGIVYRIKNDNFTNPEQITTSSLDSLTDKKYRLIVYDEKRMAILNDTDKNLWIFNIGEEDTYFRQLSQDVNNVQFSNDGKKLLYWNDYEIFAYFTRIWDVQPLRQENETISLTRYSKTIHNVQWLKDYEHILFSVGNTLKMVELDERDRHIGMDLLSNINENSQIYADFPDDRIYISTGIENSLNLFYFQFPERNGLFGG
jgi:hypothetical protein